MGEHTKVIVAKIHCDLFGERATIVQQSENESVSIISCCGKYYVVPTDELVTDEFN